MSLRSFVISLPEANERRDHIAAMMAERGLEFDVFDAVDGRAVDVPTHPAHATILRRLFFGRDMKGGEMGVLLSHRGIYQKMVDESIPMALILEDDVRLHEDIKAVLDALESGPQDFDLIRFLGSKKVMGLKQKTKRNVWGNYNLNRLSTCPGGAHAYVVTLAGARKMLTHSAHNYLPIDTLMGHCWATGVDAYIINPGLSYQDAEMPQYIGAARFDKSDLAGGWTRMLFPLTRAVFKLYEGLAKRIYYYSRAILG